MDHAIAVNLLLESRRELADAMNNVIFGEHPWGYEIFWKDLPLITGQISIIKSKDHLDNFTSSGSITPIHCILDDTRDEWEGLVHLLHREVKKIRSPFLPDYTVRKFSFDNRDLKIDSRRMTKALSEMHGTSKSEIFETERFIGGILHALNGMIWILEDQDENILAAVLYGTSDKSRHRRVELFGYDNRISNVKLLKALLETSVSFYSSNSIFVEVENDELLPIFFDLDFKSVSTLKLLK